MEVSATILDTRDYGFLCAHAVLHSRAANHEFVPHRSKLSTGILRYSTMVSWQAIYSCTRALQILDCAEQVRSVCVCECFQDLWYFTGFNHCVNIRCHITHATLHTWQRCICIVCVCTWIHVCVCVRACVCMLPLCFLKWEHPVGLHPTKTFSLCVCVCVCMMWQGALLCCLTATRARVGFPIWTRSGAQVGYLLGLSVWN